VSVRNATFQHWQTLLSNRTKRNRAGEMVVQGVRPITLALDAGWPARAVLVNSSGKRSRWATEILSHAAAQGAQQFDVAPDLLLELAEKGDEPPEVLLVVAMPADDPTRIPAPHDLLAVALDRPSSPGNVGSIVRSVDAFGGHGVFVTGHAVDPYDPRSLRASTGSIFTVPIVRLGGPQDVVRWVTDQRGRGIPIQVVGTDETGTTDVTDVDLRRPTLIVTGNETTGMSAGWRDACDVVARIPIRGQASSLNAANATTVLLYEANRQRA
jgi:TrmH family RNA methyltransferase